MPITSSAKKALRAGERKRVFNLRRKKAVENVFVDIKKLVKSGKGGEAKALLSSAYKALDKAPKENTISKNTASRKKSRLSAFVKKATSK